jgi:non-heme chloroperoxidase
MPHMTTTDDVSLFYRDWGHGQPVVFCAAWALSSVAWQYQMIALADAGYRVVAYDRRGHGRSDDPGRGYNHERLSEDLAEIIELLDLSQVTLVAHSMGSGEAVRYLARHGTDRVARLALLAPALPFLTQTPDNPDAAPATFLAERRDQWRQSFGQWILDNEGAYFGDGVTDGTVSELERTWTKADMLNTSLNAVIEFQRTAVETDFRRDLGEIKIPTLVLQGDADASAPLELTGRRTAALVPGARLVVYPSAPHGLYLTHRDRVSADLLAFVGAADARPWREVSATNADRVGLASTT